MKQNKSKQLENLTLLGNQATLYPTEYSADILETFKNDNPDRDYFVHFHCPEFTALCPMTNQPDFATIYISYIPTIEMVESKSLKLSLVLGIMARFMQIVSM